MITTAIRLRAGDRVWNNPRTITFPLREAAENTEYILVASTGLGPPEDLKSRVVNYYGEPTTTSLFSPRTLRFEKDKYTEKRQIVLRIGMNPNTSLNRSFSDLRDDVYKFIASNPQNLVTIEILNGDDLWGYSVGEVSRIETTHFAEQPEIQLTLDFEEENVLFTSPNLQSITFGTVYVSFEYNGTAPTGFYSELSRVSGDLSGFSIRPQVDLVPGPSWVFRAGVFSQEDDKISIDTTNNILTRIRGSEEQDQTQLVAPYSVWPKLYSGQNAFYSVDGVLFAFDKIEFYEKYWGI